MTKNNQYPKVVGIIIAYIIASIAAMVALLELLELSDWNYYIDSWQDYLTELSYYILLSLFILLCVIPWLKKNKLSTWWMLLSMLVTAIVIYGLLALKCQWEPAFLRREGMDLFAPWWLGGHRQFFVGLTPGTIPPFCKISLLKNEVFQSTLTDYPGLIVWAGCCLIGRYIKK